MGKLYKECVQCNHPFYLTDADQAFFAERELTLPRRCWSCRQKNRKEQEAALGKPPEGDYSSVWEERKSVRKPSRSPVRPLERRLDKRITRSRG